jgi:nucleotide-binding universal stress UspA family protein
MNRNATSDEIDAGAAPSHCLVVGFDGSSSAGSTMEWAAREAAARSASLRVVACSAVPPTVESHDFGAWKSQQLTGVIESIRRRHPELWVEDAGTHLDQRHAPADPARSADLLIVGESSSGSVKRWPLRSASRSEARRSSCPVIVVRGRQRPHLQRIVVGVDSSNASAAALDWAVAEAEYHGSELLVVHAWQPPGVVGQSVRATALDRADAQCVVDLAIRHCEKRTNQPVRGKLIEGEAAAVLTAASSDADLLAVGSRGRSGYKTMLFGSVASFVTGHARCPVAVIHPHVRS